MHRFISKHMSVGKKNLSCLYSHVRNENMQEVITLSRNHPFMTSVLRKQLLLFDGMGLNRRRKRCISCLCFFTPFSQKHDKKDQ